MPVRFDDELTEKIDRLIPTPEFEDPEPSAREVARAAFRTENTIGSIINMVSGQPDDYVDNPDFNPFDLMTEDEKLDERFVDNAALADNPAELEAVRQQMAREKKDRETMSKAGAMALPITFGTSLADPVNLIPVGGTAYRTYKTGGSVLAGAMATGSVAAGSTAVTEMALHASQLERTYGESAINMSGAFLLGSVLGGGIGALNLKRNQIAQEIEDSMNVEPKVREGADSVGAARYSEEVEIAGKKVRVFAKAVAFDPLTRMLTSEAPIARQVSNTLAENPYAMDGGITQAVESMIKLHDGKYATALEQHLTLYKELQKELGGKTGVARALNRKGMSRREFAEAVAREQRNPSDDALPQIKQAAETWEKEFYAPLRQAAIEAGLLDEGVKVSTAANYLNRVWNKQKVAANLPTFIEKVSKWLAEQDQKLFARAADMRKELEGLDPIKDKARIKEINETISKAEFKEGLDLEKVEYDDIAGQIATRIQGTPDGMLPYDFQIGSGSKSAGLAGSNVKGPLKSRKFDIPDEYVEEFLDNDIEMLAGRYLRQVAPDIELMKRFDSIDLKAEQKAISDWYDAKMKAAKTEKERLKLKDKKKSDIGDLVAMRDRIRGVYDTSDFDNPWTRIRRAARDLNYLRFMGGVVASSIPDVARIFMAEGFSKTFKYGLKPLVSNLKQFKVAAAEAKRYGVGVDAIMGGRSEIIADVADYTQGGTAIERGLRSASASFGKINLMDYWTAGVKQLHAVTMQNNVIDGMLKGKYDKRLARLGIDEANAKNIASQLRKHAKKVDGVWISNARNWDSADLEQMWGAALRKESDRVIVIPGQEKPLFMSSDLGKTILQFRSFMFSATQRMLIAGLQGQDANYLGGTLSMVTLGMMAYAFKQWDAGREISDDPATLITEGIDRSGALGVLMEANNTIEKMSGNNFGLRPLLGVKQPASRFASRSHAEAMLGPTFGSLLSTTLKVANAGSDANEWGEKDTRALRRLLPYQNLMIIRQGLDKLEQSIQ